MKLAFICCSLLINGCLSIGNLNFATIASVTTDTSSCNCPIDIQPVCLTDGVISYTYINLCIAKCNQIQQIDLNFDYNGFCCDDSMCTNEANPTCDSNGQLHLNDCYFAYAQCIQNRKFGRNLTLNTNRSSCVCNKVCTDDNNDNPVCDTFGNTHKNLCQFRNAKCYAKLRYELDIDIAYHGTCCDSHCKRLYQNYVPMCASNGKTYKSFCDFYTAQCISVKKYGKAVKIKRYGIC